MSATKTRILDVAERLTQTKGFNGFSYLDLAEEVGIKNSSIHYHFKAKIDLAEALVERTHDDLSEALSELENTTAKPEKRLKNLISYFQCYVSDDRFCLCGMMAAELYTVGPNVRERLVQYFAEFRRWIEKQFSSLGFADSKKRALQFVSTLEGALLIARLEKKPAILNQALTPFLN